MNTEDSKKSAPATTGGKQNDKDQFMWVRFYEAVADRLLMFRDQRDKLVAGIHEIDSRIKGLPPLQDRFADGSSCPLEDICPFTAMSIFNRWDGAPNHAAIAKAFADFLGVTEPIPNSFAGTPTLNNASLWFFAYHKDRQPGDIDALWEVFAQALAFSESGNSDDRVAFESAYDKAMQINWCSWSLTIGLSWIRPWKFPALDKMSRSYIENNLGVPIGRNVPGKRCCTARDYLEVVNALEGKFQSDGSPAHSIPDIYCAEQNQEVAEETVPLLDNAVVSIRLGLEDFTKSKDDDTRIFSAVRNLYAGVLLLCKEVLRRLSPPNSNDLLIRKRTNLSRDKDGNVQITGRGRQTISRDEIVNAFRQLKLTDLSNLNSLGGIRNDIEHSYSDKDPALIRKAIAEAMPIIRDVFEKELKKDPQNALGSKAWNILLREKEVSEQEKSSCLDTFSHFQWMHETLKSSAGYLSCPACSHPLKSVSDDADSIDTLVLACSGCGEIANTEDAFEQALKEVYSGAEFYSIKQGGGPLLEECPDCGREVYLVEEDQCVFCGFRLDGATCPICHEFLTAEESRRSMCFNCQHRVDKEMDT